MLVTPGSERVKVLRVGKRVTAAYFSRDIYSRNHVV